MKNLETKIAELTDSNAKKQTEMQQTLQTEIDKMRKGNEEKLEKMRETVDEKLQGTLEKRLGESFKLVSDRLEAVQRGLGEMQTLANDVGSLQKVLSNVKSRGGWGEVQLERQLEDVLAPSQYEKNVKIKPNSNDVVEFAVKLPGRADGEYVYLPIDSKFPQEDYERLQAAQDAGSAEDVATATKAVERAIRAQAKLISDKYLHAPISTDFAIMYLPTEGLFAEVVRRPGLTSDLQNNYRVLVTGPTTLMSLLNSLQMGFKTLAIEKSASDVWKVLGAAKTEFNKYSVVLDKLAKQLETAQNTVTEAGVRTRAVSKSLSKVEELEIGVTSTDILGLPLADSSDDEELDLEERQ
jgi:DNA recombination protein RmuC